MSEHASASGWRIAPNLRLAGGHGLPRWTVGLALVSCAAIPTPYGILYLMEPTALGALFLVVVLRGKSLRLTFAPILLVLIVGFMVAVGTQTESVLTVLRGPGRAMMLVLAAVVIADNLPKGSPWVNVVHPAALGSLFMLGLEVAIGHPLVPGVAVGYLTESTLRVQGPLGSGPTAALLLAATFLAFRARAWLWLWALLVAIVVTGSRSHIAALLVMLLMLSGWMLTRILAVALGLTVSATLAAWLIPGIRERITTVDQSLGGRSEVWSDAIRQVQASWPIGQPGGLNYGPFQGHNQWLSFVVLAGLLGIVVSTLLTASFLRRGWVSSSMPLVVAALLSCFAGEFLFPIIPQEGPSAAATWFVVTLGAASFAGTKPDLTPHAVVLRENGRLPAPDVLQPR